MSIEIQPNEELVILEPFVAPEHKAQMEKALEILRRQEERLLSRLSNTGDYQGAVQPMLSDLERERIISDFHSDPFRDRIIKEISMMKMMLEKPRYVIRKTGPEAKMGEVE